MAKASYRVSVDFEAEDDKEAKSRAALAAKAANGKVAKIATERLTWASLSES